MTLLHDAAVPLQDYILPVEYVNTMRDHMLDKCPVSSYKDISEVIQEDLGKTPEELFASIQEVPIASASLAQVIWNSELTSCKHYPCPSSVFAYAAAIQHEPNAQQLDVIHAQAEMMQVWDD